MIFRSHFCACMEDPVHIPSFGVHCIPRESSLPTELLDQTVSHWVYMALYSDGTPSIDNRNPDESLVSANPQCEEQGTTRSGPRPSHAPNIPNLLDLVGESSLYKPKSKSFTKVSSPTPVLESQHTDVKALIEEQMNIGQSISKQRIAELDAIVQEIIVGDTHDESGDNPADPNQPTTSANEQRGQPRLWSFMFKLLEFSGSNPSLATWVNRSQGEFQIIKPKEVAFLWGLIKNNEGMNYEKLSRGLRYYYRTGVMVRVPGRLLYKYGPKAKIWGLLKKSNNSVENHHHQHYHQQQQHSHHSVSGDHSLDTSQYNPGPSENISHMVTEQFEDVIDVLDSLESGAYNSSTVAYSGLQQTALSFNEPMDLH